MGDSEQKPAKFFQMDSDRNMTSERASRPMDQSPSSSFYGENRALSSHTEDSRTYLTSSQPNAKLLTQLPFEIAAGSKVGINGIGHYEMDNETLRTQSPYSAMGESHENCNRIVI